MVKDLTAHSQVSGSSVTMLVTLELPFGLHIVYVIRFRSTTITCITYSDQITDQISIPWP